MYVPADRFIEAVMIANTIQDVADATGLQPLSVYQRIRTYRKKGVNLPELSSGKKRGRQFNVDSANALIESLS